MIDDNITPQPVLKIAGSDPRAMHYQVIADVHRQVVEAKWKARTTNTQFGLRPEIVIHLEESVAFLAEELLKLQVMFDSDFKGMVKQGIEEALVVTAEALKSTEDGTPEEMVAAVAKGLDEKLEETHPFPSSGVAPGLAEAGELPKENLFNVAPQEDGALGTAVPPEKKG